MSNKSLVQTDIT